MHRRTIQCPQLVVATSVLLVLALVNAASAAQWGNMKADSILFLGNSICIHGPLAGWSPVGGWGLAASEPSKDYVHLFTTKINGVTGGSIALNPQPLNTPAWKYGDPLPNITGNIVNVADIFERSFSTWDNARIQNQLNAKPDIVVLQVGENLANGTPEQFAVAMDTLLAGIKSASNPHIFITSYILGSNPAIDAIKRAACAEDPSHRTFVNLVGKVDLGIADHPNDAGMATIADTLFASVPEPTTTTLLFSGLIGLLVYAWRKRK
jgi:hypothetical protein